MSSAVARPPRQCQPSPLAPEHRPEASRRSRRLFRPRALTSSPPSLLSPPFFARTDTSPRVPGSHKPLPTESGESSTTSTGPDCGSDTINSDDPRYARPGQKRKHYTHHGEYCDDPWPRKMRKIRPGEDGEHPGFIEMPVVEPILASAVGANLETSPSNPVTSQYQLPTPIPSPEPFLPPPGCEHPRHPAYSALQDEPICPACSLEHLTCDLHRVERRMLRQSNESKKRFLLLGSDRGNPHRKILDAYGYDISHRHCRLRLSNLQIKLEGLAQKETEFEDLFLLGHSDLTSHSQAGELFDRTYGTRYEYTARYALSYYSACEARGDFTRSTTDDAAYVQERGREQEIATQEGYPEDPDERPSTHIRSCTTEAQEAYVDNSTVPSISDDIFVSSPKRQRRNTKTKVSFSSDSQVCIESDIDRLLKQAFNFACTSRAIGIIRTATSPSEADVSLGSRFNTDPRRRYYTVPTKQTDYGRNINWCRRKSSSYKSNQWAASLGSSAVDTSGHTIYKKDPMVWDSYCEGLQDQAAKWGRSDEMNVSI